MNEKEKPVWTPKEEWKLIDLGDKITFPLECAVCGEDILRFGMGKDSLVLYNLGKRSKTWTLEDKAPLHKSCFFYNIVRAQRTKTKIDKPTGRPKGYKMSEERKEKMSKRMLEHWRKKREW